MLIRLGFLAIALTLAMAGCAHLPAMGQQSGDSGAPQASDGLVISMPLPVAAAVDTTVGVLQARGYVLDSRRGARTLRTRPRMLGGDTSIVWARLREIEDALRLVRHAAVGR